MTILLAPAETKNEGGVEKTFRKENFFLENKFNEREYIFNEYEKFISMSSLEDLSKWFGIKKLSLVEKYKVSLRDKKSMKAIQRYNGVAFDALSYESLDFEAQEYIDNNVLLFSNLFGPIKAKDLIPDYKFKQGSKLNDIKVEKFYSDNFTCKLDEYIDNEVFDLRAVHYEKFYKTTNKKVMCFKFLKDGKVVSHWAKYYRGVLLKHLAINKIQSFEEFKTLQLPNLELLEVQEKKNITTMIMNIT